MGNKLVPKPCKIIEKDDEGEETFTIVLDSKLNPAPGQFVQISVPGIGEAPISCASYSNDHIRLTIRKVGTVTNYISRMKVGDTVHIRGPYGNGFPMEEAKGNDLILVGGGCGVAPFFGVNEYIMKNRKDFGKVYLFFGFRSGDHVLYTDEIKSWKEEFLTEITIDKMEGKSCQNYKEGFVTEIIKKTDIDNKDKLVFMCGPPVMMSIAGDIFKEKGFNKDQIFVSTERLMHCGFGNCCHCMIEGKLCCKDGPVFRLDEIEEGLRRGKEAKT
jgi:sulfite reductase subunit B